MIDQSKDYYEVRSRYLAEALAFLGFRYIKLGFGKETLYSFEDTYDFRFYLTRLLDLKKSVGR